MNSFRHEVIRFPNPENPLERQVWTKDLGR